MSQMSYFEFVLPIVDKVENLKCLINISNTAVVDPVGQEEQAATSADDDVRLLCELDSELTRLESWVKQMKHSLELERPYISKVQELRLLAEKQRDYLMYSLEPNIQERQYAASPNHDVSPTTTTTVSSGRDTLSKASLKLHNQNNNRSYSEDHGGEESVKSSSSNLQRLSKRSRSDEDNNENMTKEEPINNCDSSVHLITEVSDEEMITVPKYIKSRLNSAKINESVRTMNELLAKKYHLLTVPDAKLNANQVNRVRQLRRDCKSFNNHQFFSEQELLSSKYRFDSSGKASIQVLRHLKRLREIRKPGEKEVTYIVLQLQ